MAPEQLDGVPATTATDIYSLGLVLFEAFTGKRVHEAQTFAELRALHDTGTVTTPSSIVRDLDPAVERVILRCLDVDPRKRPPSALAVAAALPGGRVLDEMLASGLTPSPELLASVAESDAVPLWRALVLVLAVISGVGLFAAFAPSVTLARLVPLDKPPAVLADRAEQMLATLGYGGARGDTAEGFVASTDYISWIAQTDQSPQRWQRLATDSPALLYWYRTSPRELVPRPLALRATPNDPPPADSGMHTVMLDTDGRLLQLNVVPPQFDADAAVGESAPPWPQLFHAAGLDIAAFSPAAPQWNPRDYADTRAAWEGPLDDSGVKVRVEASSYRGQPVSFTIVGPWTRANRMQVPARSPGDRAAYTVVYFTAIGLIAGAVLLARHNVRAGRADLAGATRLAAAATSIELTAWLFGFQHLADVRAEIGSLAVIAGDAVFVGVLLWVAYVAIEPYCRRFWPDMLLGWSRLLTGHIRDARVGRDVLVGLGAGVLWLGIDLTRRLLPQALGYPAMLPRTGGELNFAGAPCGTCNAISTWSILALRQLIPVFLSLLLFLVLRLVTRRQWPAIAVGGLAIFFWWSNFGSATAFWIEFGAEALIVVLFTGVMIRGGILPALVAMFVVNVCQTVAMTLDVTHWSATTSNLTLVLIIALTAYAFIAARAGEPIFGKLPHEI
jgi:Protein tyrosine and serine/threonine kinase